MDALALIDEKVQALVEGPHVLWGRDRVADALREVRVAVAAEREQWEQELALHRQGLGRRAL